MQNILVPTVVEKDPRGQERYFDIYSRLLKDFVVFITGPIDMAAANTFIAQLLFLQNTDEKRTINVYINSEGGISYAGHSMYDTMKHIKNDISTINVGLAASAAAMLLSGGTKGKRFTLPSAHTMIHETRIDGGLDGPYTDLDITIQQMKRVKDDYAKNISKDTGKTLKTVVKDLSRDKWFNAEESVKYGLVDEILKPEK